MKIATWNVNSVRSRLDHVTGWLQENPVDFLCLQETKVIDSDFPRSAFTDLGYHLEISGQKSYNGVAIASRQPVDHCAIGFGAVLDAELVGDLDDQKRVIMVRSGDLVLVDLYVPNGSEIGSEKYVYKLRWLALLKTYLAELLSQYPQVCVCGDFNIAYEDRDIHNPKNRETHIMASDDERAALKTSVLDLGFQDAFRLFYDEGDRFSWWDYRSGGFQRNRGWRIDHLYLSPALIPAARSCEIDIEPRKLEKPSDHTPVVLDLAID
ncbi:exodeoxyribonuclease III [Limnothrix sp. FACHB-708]|uniref:exodeoxyribonuclease III n=1 Tax=unclassified Limnothrix TaxID=2632864 RepID=UPI001683D4DF|nr:MULTISPECIES: exodeoxyribonuclease III [unclassified Limnothrix]MBD2551839.1 exodeoxyribonuclease III [Limnothrix sp. FACHB-708]MBD2589518.1 exodeoxyribonuclease III [Limnothrix sp. FACHB-406]